jgi:hypothetical protein
MCFGSGLSHIATSGMPFQVGALMDGTARDAGQAGFFAFLEVGALSMGMILVSIMAERITPTLTGIAGALLAAGANMGLFFVRSFDIQLILGTLAGLGFGLVFAATVAGGASSKDADRTYAIGLGGALMLVVAIIAILPYASRRMGDMGVFACIAVVALMCTPLFLGFRTGTKAEVQARSVWGTEGARGLLFSWATFSMGTSAVYVFAERIGRGIAIAPTTIGWVLSSGVFIGLLGTTLAALGGRRLNRRSALYSGLLGSALSCLMIGYATTLALYAGGVYLFWICTMFLYCYMLGSAALLDGSGRLGTLGSGTERLGYATGAWAGGELAQHTSFAAVGLFGCAVCVLGVVLGYPSLCRALDRRRAALAT